MSLPCPYKCICSIFFPAVIYFSCFRGWYPARKKLLQSIYFYMYTLYNFWICVNKKALCTQNRPSAGKKCTAGKKNCSTLFVFSCLKPQTQKRALQPLLLWHTIIGPLLDDGLKRGTPKSLKGLPLSLLFCLCVCLFVCQQATGHSFQPSNLIF